VLRCRIQQLVRRVLLLRKAVQNHGHGLEAGGSSGCAKWWKGWNAWIGWNGTDKASGGVRCWLCGCRSSAAHTT
jgi:hypothetical protein